MTEEDDDELQRDGTSPGKAGSLNKACEACRGSKLRCIVDEDSADGSCKRCLATARTCVFKAPRQRQRRKVHVDARVAELERQLRSLRMQLHQVQNPSTVSPTTSAPPGTSTLRFEPPVTPQSWPRKSAAVAEDPVFKDSSCSSQASPNVNAVRSIEDSTDDVVDRNVVEWSEANRLVQVYLADFAPSYPFVTLPFFTNTATLRRERPATFLAVLVAASTTSSSELNTTLNHELLALLARRIMFEGEHNLDLVQAMIIVTIWYAPMEKFESLRHYQFAHLAATIAMDLGLGDMPTQLDGDFSNSNDLDRRRTLLSIYLLCTGISVTTGRSKMLRFTDYMQSCINHFKNCVGLSVQDHWFLAWIELQRLTEFAASRFFVSPTDISVPSNQTAVVDFCRTLDHWKRDLGFELGGALEIHYHYVRSIVLSVCLYVDHDMRDFLPPFRVKPLYASMPPPTPLSPFYARTAMALVRNVHSALDTFLGFDTIALLATPVIYYIRTLHPFSILLMLDMACRRPGNELCKILDSDALKVKEYFRQFKKMLAPYANQPRKTPAKFLAIVNQMESWWLVQSQPGAGTSPDLRPFGRLQNPSVDVVNAAGSPTEDQTLNTKIFHPSGPSTATGGLASTIGIGSDQASPGYQDTMAMMDDEALFQDNWVLDFDHDPSMLLLPEIDWALFEEQEMTNAT